MHHKSASNYSWQEKKRKEEKENERCFLMASCASKNHQWISSNAFFSTSIVCCESNEQTYDWNSCSISVFNLLLIEFFRVVRIGRRNWVLFFICFTTNQHFFLARFHFHVRFRFHFQLHFSLKLWNKPCSRSCSFLLMHFWLFVGFFVKRRQCEFFFLVFISCVLVSVVCCEFSSFCLTQTHATTSRFVNACVSQTF